MARSNRAERTEPQLRREQILDAAITLSLKIGYRSITRDAVAGEAGISSSLIAHYFPVMEDLKTKVMEYAIEDERLAILAQGLAINDPLTLAIPDELKNRVIQFLSEK